MGICSFAGKNSFCNCLSHNSSLVAVGSPMYSASVVDNATVGCRWLFQEIAPPRNVNTYPAHERRSSLSLAQSASQNPIIVLLLDFENSNLVFAVPFRYLKILLTAAQWAGRGLLLNTLTVFTACEMFSTQWIPPICCADVMILGLPSVSKPYAIREYLQTTSDLRCDLLFFLIFEILTTIQYFIKSQ